MGKVIGIIAIVFMVAMCSKLYNGPSTTNTNTNSQITSTTSKDYEHDLAERCKDLIYLRNRAYKLERDGDQQGAERARIAMQTFDRDLRKYFSEKEISDEITRLEASGYKVGL